MQLIKIYANKKSFRIIEFEQNKPNFILAKQEKSGTSDFGKTYNGVGKSLLIKIIHYCLGASSKSYKNFCEKLPDWEFSLEFMINDVLYTTTRSTKKPNIIDVNNESMRIDEFNKRMRGLCFTIPEDSAFLSFRSLLPFFLRPQKASYADCKKPGKTGSEYQDLLYNSFLIGLDITLAKKKYLLKKDQDNIKVLEKNFKNDSFLKNFFTGNKDVALTLIDLDEKIQELQFNMENFQIANDYYDIKKEADVTEQSLFDIKNEILLLSLSIDDIEESLTIAPAMQGSDIEAVYEEACMLFPDTIKKKLSEVDGFYSKLIESRVHRLSEQKNKLVLQLNDKKKDSEHITMKLDNLLKYLGEHQALDLFVALSNKIAELKSEKENLEKYQELQLEYKKRARQIEKEMIELSELTDNYLVGIEDSTNDMRTYFRDLSKIFYPNSVSGLAITTNEGDNQLAFNIDPRIESDGSDGISNVKLFCYDLSILFKGKNHQINFIFHDSRLFDGVDERQKTLMFRTIYQYFNGSNKQYIASINQNQLNEIKSLLTEEEYENIVEKNIVLTLTDENDAQKLLGIKVDIGE